MDKLSNLLRSHPSSEPFSEEDFIRRVNAQQGKEMREGYDCPLCLNKEFRMVIENGDRIHRSCKCFWIRQSLARLRKRGLLDLYKQCTFGSFTTDELGQLKRGSVYGKTQKEWFKEWLDNCLKNSVKNELLRKMRTVTERNRVDSVRFLRFL